VFSEDNPYSPFSHTHQVRRCLLLSSLFKTYTKYRDLDMLWKIYFLYELGTCSNNLDLIFFGAIFLILGMSVMAISGGHTRE